MKNATIECSRCNGRGILTGAVDLSIRTCWLCNGKGRLTNARIKQMRSSSAASPYLPKEDKP